MVIAAIEYGSAAPADAVHRTREARTDALHPACERVLALRLDDQVRVIALKGVVRDAEAAAFARFGEGAAPLADERTAAQRPHAGEHAQRHVHGAAPRHGLAFPVQHARPRAARTAG